MSYQVLARKWRPANFDQLVGQQQTSQALINALESQRLHHAYLFTGTRGVGKTTIARILSKSLNCDTGITSNPCGECSSCVEISQGNFVDLLEIDAASKTKVEDTRELLDNVQYRPTRGRYKVYLIDEVHMLSGHSFNALLKTLEEPPPHVIFLLATTDPQKLPVTVLSRCLQFHLRRMQIDEITEHLSFILKAEFIDFETEALLTIAKGADGSMRDALSLLDQAIAFGGNNVKHEAVLNMLGSIDKSFSFKLLNAINESDAKQLLEVISQIAEYAPDYDELLADWLSLLYNVALEQAVSGHSDDENIQQWASKASPADIQLFYQLSLQARRDLAFASSPKQGFEMAMLRIVAFKPQTISQQPNTSEQSSSAKKKVDNKVSPSQTQEAQNQEAQSQESQNQVTLKQNVSQTNEPEFNQVNHQQERLSKSEQQPNQEHSTLTVVVDNTPPKTELVPQISAQSSSEAIQLNPINLEQITQDNWFQVIEALDINGQGLQVLLNSIADYQDNILTIHYLTKVAPLLTNSAQTLIIKTLCDYFNSAKINVSFNLLAELSDSIETPRQRKDRLYQLAIENAQSKLLANSQVNYLIDELGATLSKESIRLTQS